MEFSNYFSKKTLITICIIIVIIIILRIIYSSFYSNIENFSSCDDPKIDLLIKNKNATKFQYSNDTTDTSSELSIHPWSNTVYNKNSSIQLKPISLYKPILSLSDNSGTIVKYAKLGDIVIQSDNTKNSITNNDTTLPFLLIKKFSSDIQPCIRFDKIVNYTVPGFNKDFYTYQQYLTNIGTTNLANVSKSLAVCNSAFTDLDTLINKNILLLKTSFTALINNNSKINIDNQSISNKRFITNAESISPNITGQTLNSNQSDILRPIIKMLEDDGIIEEFYSKNTNRNNGINEHFNNSDYTEFIANNNSTQTKITAKSSTPINNNLLTLTINSSSQLILPAGIQGFIQYTDNADNTVYIDISIPANIDSDQNSNIQDIINKLPLKPFSNIQNKNILIIKYPEIDNSIFTYIPIKDIIKYINNLCTEIKNIYVINSQNINLLNYLNLSNNADTVNNILIVTSKYSNINIVNNINLLTFFNDLSNANIDTNDTTNLLGLVLYTIKQMMLTYYLTYLSFKPSDINIHSTSDMKITINSINNDFISNIPSSNYKITNNLDLNLLTNSIMPNITKFFNYITTATTSSSSSSDSSNSTLERTIHDSTIVSSLNSSESSYNVYLKKNTNIRSWTSLLNPTITKSAPFANIIEGFDANTQSNLPPIQIYNPIAPDGYTSLGHVFCTNDIESQLLNKNDIACVPSNCVKEMRDWVQNDKIFEYNKNDIYWAIYYNPYIGTFIGTNTHALPDGKVCKVVACVKQNNSVKILQKADKCIRQYYNLNKKAKTNSPISSKLVSDQEEIDYLTKIKAQSDSIAKLNTRSQQMQIDIDKANIINREMNKHSLQDYNDTQKRNINIIMQKLKDDKNKIQTNINIPTNVINEIINIINTLSPEQQKNILKIIDSQNILTTPQLNQIISSCPQYNLDGLVKKNIATDVCYGCDIPK